MNATRGVRVVYDCNVYLQALINPDGPAGRCVEAARSGEALLYWSAFVAEELRRTASRPWLTAKFRHLTSDRLDDYVLNIERIARIVESVPAVFTLDRDPDDAHYVNLALAAEATLIVSRDNDLLSLMDDATAEGRAFRARFPGMRVLTPPGFIAELTAPLR